MLPMSHDGNSIRWVIDKFDDLDIHKLYKILHLRADVFVVEQNCPYLDPDFKDQKALHVQGYISDKLVAYCRLFAKGDYFKNASIGRVIVAKGYRRSNFGHILMNKAIEFQKTILGESLITISAQEYLKTFYERHGFVQISDTYLEDDIPHIKMIRNNI